MSFSQWGTKSQEEAENQDEDFDYQDGDYEFEVYKAELKLSPNNNYYILLKKKVNIPGYGKVYSDDTLVDHKSMFFKRKHFWESVGYPQKLNEASPEEYERRGGIGHYIVEEYYSKKQGRNRKKLVCTDYVVKEKINSEIFEFKDDDIPF